MVVSFFMYHFDLFSLESFVIVFFGFLKLSFFGVPFELMMTLPVSAYYEPVPIPSKRVSSSIIDNLFYFLKNYYLSSLGLGNDEIESRNSLFSSVI